jgi:hypothetical protein
VPAAKAADRKHGSLFRKLRRKIRSYLAFIRPIEPRVVTTKAELEAERREYDRWRLDHPGRPAHEYFAARRQILLSGAAHSTIGHKLRDGPFEEAGREEFEYLLHLGLKPEHICVDYGCGTLRIGQHVIRYLAPDHFWGFDVLPQFLKTGPALIGDELVLQKRPRLRLVAPKAIAEANRERPDIVYSYKVMQHVFPDDLDEYLGNISSLIGSWGLAYIMDSKWRENETVQYRAAGWAHNFSTIEAFFRRQGQRVETLWSKTKSLSSEGAGDATFGTLRISAQ